MEEDSRTQGEEWEGLRREPYTEDLHGQSATVTRSRVCCQKEVQGKLEK